MGGPLKPQRDPGDRLIGLTCLLALAIHGLAGFLLVSRGIKAPKSVEALGAMDLEVDLDQSVAEPTETPDPSTFPDDVPRPEMRHDESVRPPSQSNPQENLVYGGEGNGKPDETWSGGPPPAETAPPAEAWSGGSHAFKSLDLGLSGAVRTAEFGRTQDAGARPGPAGGLREALAEADKGHAIGTGGPLIRAAREAVADSMAPLVGNARFEVLTDERGVAVSVRLIDATSHGPEWDAAAKQILALVKRQKPLPIPRGDKGHGYTLAVQSKMSMPSGSTSGMPSIAAQPTGQIMGQFDVSDIGAKPHRDIRISVVDERRL